ncbi:MAG TPA: ABC-F family ATP-binding cassette domain-containing protein [Sphingobacterium sp.]|nr:ABC-F family ATP-binding cassette domain-containing protein [Sphingobacterium sp.]
MSILAGENISQSFNDQWLLKNVNFSLQSGSKVALVGHNGSGKSTLLKILAGLLIPDEGSIIKQDGIELGYLPQEFTHTHSETVFDFIFKTKNKIQKLISDYESLISDPHSDQKELQILMDQISANDAWDYENRSKTILSKLGITNTERLIQTLSGGEKKRLSLAKLLILDPDIYILDEPTNHLDIETIEWLEKLLQKNNKTVLFVSHDRYFLDTVCTEIREIDHGRIYTYSGKYADYLEQKAEREEIEKISSEKANNLLRKELEWMRRQPKARGTKSKSRIDSFYDLEKKAKKNIHKKDISLASNMQRQGGKILEIENLNKSFSNKNIVKNFSYVFKRHDRIGLIGKNGTGKSTFIKLLTQEIEPDMGHINLGETTRIGYYRQEGLPLDDTKRVIEVVTDVAEFIQVTKGENISAAQLLNRFLFPPEKQYDLVKKLSGGERKRLQLMRVLMTNPNFLILDEPSNDLDIDTLNILEEFLLEYRGVLILVSHDRYLVDKICNQLFIFEEFGTIRIYNGNYTSFLDLKEEKEKPTLKSDSIKKEREEKEKKKLTYKEKLELENIEKEIEDIEIKTSDLTESLNQTTDYKELEEISTNIKTLQIKMEKKMERWMYLSNFE